MDNSKIFQTIFSIFLDVTSLGKGFAECVYQEAICVLLRKHNIIYSKESILPILFQNCTVGNVRADIVLTDHIIECKAIEASLRTSHVPQIIAYMKLTNKPFGILVNFNQKVTNDILETIFVEEYNDTYKAIFNKDDSQIFYFDKLGKQIN
jgi:GxxExxY protein